MGLDRRRKDNEEIVLAALTLGAELLDHASEYALAMRAAQILEAHAVDRADIARADDTESARRRRQQIALLCEVRSDLLAVVRRCHRLSFDRAAFADGIAAGLCAATDKLVVGADMETYRAWQRGMVLKISEVRTPDGPPRAMATVDAGPGRGPLTVEWDSCERRLALVARMARAGESPVAICDRLLADLSMSSPLRFSIR